MKVLLLIIGGLFLVTTWAIVMGTFLIPLLEIWEDRWKGWLKLHKGDRRTIQQLREDNKHFANQNIDYRLENIRLKEILGKNNIEWRR